MSISVEGSLPSPIGADVPDARTHAQHHTSKANLCRPRGRAPQGLDQWVSLTLDEPIICNDQEIECAVIVNISNSHPNIVSVEPCYVRWHRDEWHHTRRVRVSFSIPPSLASPIL